MKSEVQSIWIREQSQNCKFVGVNAKTTNLGTRRNRCITCSQILAGEAL